MMADKLQIFSYGSNMWTKKLRTHCSSALAKGVAELRGFELRWHKVSIDGSGKCDIVQSENSEIRVFGVLYEIVSGEKQNLDSAEGLGQGYEEIDVKIVCNGLKTFAKAYRAINIDQEIKPYSWYKARVIAGAREHGLPKDYIAQIEQIACDEDPDRKRHQAKVRLIEEARS